LSSRKNRKDARYQKAGGHSDEKTERREPLQGIFALGQANIPCARSPERCQRHELILTIRSLVFKMEDGHPCGQIQKTGVNPETIRSFFIGQRRRFKLLSLHKQGKRTEKSQIC
jgi:hypothetical protein